MKFVKKSLAFSWKLLWQACGAWVILYLALDTLLSVFPILDLYLLKVLLNTVTEGAKSAIVSTMLLLAVVTAFGIIFNRLQSVISHRVVEKTDVQFTHIIMEKFSKMPFEVLDTSEGRDLCDYANCCSGIVCDELPFGLFYILKNIYTFSIAFVVLIKFNAFFCLLFLLLTAPGILLDFWFDKKAEDLRRKTAPDMRKLNYYQWMLVDSWPAKDVRMYDLTDSIKARYVEERQHYYKQTQKLDKKRLAASLVSEIIRRSGEIIFILFVVLSAIHGKITVGEIVLLTGYAVIISETFYSIVSKFIGYVKFDSETVMPRFFEFMDIPCADNRKGVRELRSFESLTFDNVYFKYPHTEQYILSGASFTLHAGEKLSVIGINGAGKSTLIKLMLGLYEIESGRILINGYPMSDYDMQDVQGLFSVLFQDFVQYPLTLRENVALSDPKYLKNDEKIEAALHKSGVYEAIASKLENGLDSYMTRQFDDKGTELSKGQWQKIALSRAYFKEAPITVLDEPSAALDAEAEERIFQDFEKISHGKTGIMISHRISSAKIADKIIVLDCGKIVECGKHDELLSQKGLYAKLYNLQREKYTRKEANEYEKAQKHDI